jgi:hypothetical protein
MSIDVEVRVLTWQKMINEKTSRVPSIRIGKSFGENVCGLLVGLLPNMVIFWLLEAFM